MTVILRVLKYTYHCSAPSIAKYEWLVHLEVSTEYEVDGTESAYSQKFGALAIFQIPYCVYCRSFRLCDKHDLLQHWKIVMIEPCFRQGPVRRVPSSI
jgi:hypothetical protein